MNKDGLPKEALKDLRLEKKVIKTQMEELKQEYENDANRHFFGRFPAEICGSMIQYKNCVTGTSMGELSQQVPQFKKVQGHLLWDMPIFTDNILGLSQALEEKRPLAVLGGPCLFGSWELGISFMDSKGNIQWFDFSSGKNYLRSGDTVFDYSLDIQDYLNKNNNKITEIHFKNYKKISLPKNTTLWITFSHLQNNLEHLHLFRFLTALTRSIYTVFFQSWKTDLWWKMPKENLLPQPTKSL